MLGWAVYSVTSAATAGRQNGPVILAQASDQSSRPKPDAPKEDKAFDPSEYTLPEWYHLYDRHKMGKTIDNNIKKIFEASEYDPDTKRACSSAIGKVGKPAVPYIINFTEASPSSHKWDSAKELLLDIYDGDESKAKKAIAYFWNKDNKVGDEFFFSALLESGRINFADTIYRSFEQNPSIGQFDQTFKALRKMGKDPVPLFIKILSGNDQGRSKQAEETLTNNLSKEELELSVVKYADLSMDHPPRLVFNIIAGRKDPKYTDFILRAFDASDPPRKYVSNNECINALGKMGVDGIPGLLKAMSAHSVYAPDCIAEMQNMGEPAIRVLVSRLGEGNYEENRIIELALQTLLKEEVQSKVDLYAGYWPKDYKVRSPLVAAHIRNLWYQGSIASDMPKLVEALGAKSPNGGNVESFDYIIKSEEILKELYQNSFYKMIVAHWQDTYSVQTRGVAEALSSTRDPKYLPELLDAAEKNFFAENCIVMMGDSVAPDLVKEMGKANSKHPDLAERILEKILKFDDDKISDTVIENWDPGYIARSFNVAKILIGSDDKKYVDSILAAPNDKVRRLDVITLFAEKKQPDNMTERLYTRLEDKTQPAEKRIMIIEIFQMRGEKKALPTLYDILGVGLFTFRERNKRVTDAAYLAVEEIRRKNKMK